MSASWSRYAPDRLGLREDIPSGELHDKNPSLGETLGHLGLRVTAGVGTVFCVICLISTWKAPSANEKGSCVWCQTTICQVTVLYLNSTQVSYPNPRPQFRVIRPTSPLPSRTTSLSRSTLSQGVLCKYHPNLSISGGSLGRSGL